MNEHGHMRLDPRRFLCEDQSHPAGGAPGQSDSSPLYVPFLPSPGRTDTQWSNDHNLCSKCVNPLALAVALPSGIRCKRSPEKQRMAATLHRDALHGLLGGSADRSPSMLRRRADHTNPALRGSGVRTIGVVVTASGHRSFDLFSCAARLSGHDGALESRVHGCCLSLLERGETGSQTERSESRGP